ncbi:MAG: hypothetical protein PHS53_00735 [Candidatus Pacebacteria bacterium]|nr:hypothetical protein [Candidatus Paceibacterota bacterium]MDD5356663.1 hypothetical protein [Candidatus Paceibacterota bacterium]
MLHFLYGTIRSNGSIEENPHMLLANHNKDKKPWPTFALPKERGKIRVSDVMNISPGAASEPWDGTQGARPERVDARQGRKIFQQKNTFDTRINEWSQSVWDAWEGSHEAVRIWAEREGLE